MLTKTKIALAAALVAGTASVAFAQDADPNLLNRYPAYNGTVQAQTPNFQSAPVGLAQEPALNVPSTTGRPGVETFRYDSAPLISGGGY